MFPVEYGPKYDTALHVLLWELLSKLEKMLPVPDLKQVFIFVKSYRDNSNIFLHDVCILLHFQTAAWVGSFPSALDDCVQPSPEELSSIFQLYRSSGLMKVQCK